MFLSQSWNFWWSSRVCLLKSYLGKVKVLYVYFFMLQIKMSNTKTKPDCMFHSCKTNIWERQISSPLMMKFTLKVTSNNLADNKFLLLLVPCPLPNVEYHICYNNFGGNRSKQWYHRFLIPVSQIPQPWCLSSTWVSFSDYLTFYDKMHNIIFCRISYHMPKIL